MIGFNALGRMGRLGNQMFQYAALKGIARNIGADITIPYYTDAVNDGIGNMLRTELFDSFDLNVNVGLLDSGQATTLHERHFHYDEEFFYRCPDNVSLQGYFQTEKYFRNIKSEIRDDFTFKEEILTPCKELVSQLDNPLALHVRRTDYISNSANHPPCPLSYYEKALKHFDDRQVIVFSDDPAWCKEQELFSNDRFMVSENDDNRVDLCLMSLCSDFIIANSTYSWWGAWLSTNKNKKVIAPVQWFGTGYTKDHDTSDLIPDGWTRIDA
jgi:hypothetical protein